MPGIGLLNEKPLHASLKEWYAQPGDQFEVAVDGFVIDIVRDNLLLEIQTGNLASIKSKLTNLACSHQIRLIYPIAQEKLLVKLAKRGSGGIKRRKSPKRGRVEDLFWEIVSFPQLLANPNFSLEVLLIREEEVRRFEGKRNWRRRGWVVEERRLLEVVERRLYQEPADWRAFLPKDMDTFTARDLAEATAISGQLAQKMVYCLRKVSVLELLGKQGRANLYRVVDT
ncbi:MAG: hypothetical protein JSW71_08490 [Gemmatimonadota bacterium]|nr:MAG: hypothetical protein JSW71_08490 [Gemmatimonadota bacterium]